MQITTWGTRGSIPVTGSQFHKYGGDTFCIEVLSSQGDQLIIDAGSGIRSLSTNLEAHDTDFALLFTHYHLDHLLGFPFFEPLFKEQTNLALFGPLVRNEFSLKGSLQHFISPPLFPFDLESHAIKASLSYETVKSGSKWSYGSLSIEAIDVEHTCDETLGYRIEEHGKSIVVLIDNELQLCSSEKKADLLTFAHKADLLLTDAHFTDEEYLAHTRWGHSSLNDAITFAREAKVATCGFLHYAPHRTDDEIDQLYTEHSTDTTQCLPVKQGQVFEL